MLLIPDVGRIRDNQSRSIERYKIKQQLVEVIEVIARESVRISRRIHRAQFSSNWQSFVAAMRDGKKKTIESIIADQSHVVTWTRHAWSGVSLPRRHVKPIRRLDSTD